MAGLLMKLSMLFIDFKKKRFRAQQDFPYLG